MNSLFGCTIIQDDIKAARHGDDELMQPFVRVPTTFGPTGNVIQVIDTPNIKRDMSTAFNKGQIPTRILNLRKIYYLTEIDIHIDSSSGKNSDSRRQELLVPPQRLLNRSLVYFVKPIQLTFANFVRPKIFMKSPNTRISSPDIKMRTVKFQEPNSI